MEKATQLDATNFTPLVSTQWLAEHLDDPAVRIADVRWYLPHLGRRGADEYRAGHIPGAVFVDLDTELAGPAAHGPGRHPIPNATVFGAAMSRVGIGSLTHVVAYDDAGGSIAARLWWLLRYYGHDRVSVLDGGITRWTAEGRPLQSDTTSHSPATFTPCPRQGWVADTEMVLSLSRDPQAVLLDARAAERYEGKVEPIDARPGHIPGARSAPFASNLDEGHPPEFKSPAELRARYEKLGVAPGKTLVAYCGSGVTACHTLLALTLAGYPDALLYEGSWSAWSRDTNLPAATGPDRP
jgi:thiosulfate/3-mercaptopyruvate sulfurtransferase